MEAEGKTTYRVPVKMGDGAFKTVRKEEHELSDIEKQFLMGELIQAWNNNPPCNRLAFTHKVMFAVNESLRTCNAFEPDTQTSSATICKNCGQEKISHK